MLESAGFVEVTFDDDVSDGEEGATLSLIHI